LKCKARLKIERKLGLEEQKKNHFLKDYYLDEETSSYC